MAAGRSVTGGPIDVTERFDLAVRNGRVLDTSQGIDALGTVFIRDGRFAAIGQADDPRQADEAVDASGFLVVPGLVDLHTHCYWGATPLGVNADKIGPATGVTTWVDTGSAGAGNFEGFFHHVIARSSVRIIPLLHISHIGLTAAAGLYVPVGELFDFRMASFHEIVRVGEAFGDVIAGVKVRASVNATGPNSGDALKIARAAADALDTRLMVHIGPPPPLIEDVLAYMTEGDIVTHCFTPYHGGILDRNSEVKACVRAARERGVLFDVGHGSGSFAFHVAQAALDQGFPPDAISSDLHSKCVRAPVIDLPTTMTKFLAMGMDLQDVLARVTQMAASAVGRSDLGTLALGAPADLALLALENVDVELKDVVGASRTSAMAITARATFVNGKRLQPIMDGRQEEHPSGPFPTLTTLRKGRSYGS